MAQQTNTVALATGVWVEQTQTSAERILLSANADIYFAYADDGLTLSLSESEAHLLRRGDVKEVPLVPANSSLYLMCPSQDTTAVVTDLVAGTA